MGKIKHDVYLDHLCDKIEKKYDAIYTHLPLYSKKGRRVAEIDVMAIKDDSVDIYEVKCSYRISKAKKQLKKIKKKLPSIRNLFFFCGESGALKLI